jgi:DNA primase small subunit
VRVDCDKTSLKPYVDFFKNFVAGLLRDEGAIKRERNEGAGDAMEF